MGLASGLATDAAQDMITCKVGLARLAPQPARVSLEGGADNQGGGMHGLTTHATLSLMELPTTMLGCRALVVELVGVGQRVLRGGLMVTPERKHDTSTSASKTCRVSGNDSDLR